MTCQNLLNQLSDKPQLTPKDKFTACCEAGTKLTSVSAVFPPKLAATGITIHTHYLQNPRSLCTFLKLIFMWQF